MPTEMTHEAIEQLLSEQMVGRLGLIEDSLPYVVPISYAYRDGAVYCHSAQGKKVRALRSQPEVCFEVDEVEGLDRWRSVIAYGTFEQLVGPQAKAGMNVLLDRFRPLVPVAAGDPPSGAGLGMMRTLDVPRSPEAQAELGRPSAAAVVFRVNIRTTSGRAEGER